MKLFIIVYFFMNIIQLVYGSCNQSSFMICQNPEIRGFRSYKVRLWIYGRMDDEITFDASKLTATEQRCHKSGSFCFTPKCGGSTTAITSCAIDVLQNGYKKTYHQGMDPRKTSDASLFTCYHYADCVPEWD